MRCAGVERLKRRRGSREVSILASACARETERNAHAHARTAGEAGRDVDDEDEAAENPEEAEEPLKEEPAVEEASAGKQAVLLEFDFNTAKKGKKKKAKPKKPV